MDNRALNTQFGDFSRIHQAQDWEVLSAVDRKDGKKRVIKLSPLSFEREGKFLSHLKHDGWAQIQDWGWDPQFKKYYLIRDYCKGEPLSCKGPWSFSDLLALMVQLARVLYYLHQNKVAYLDLKPENVIWDGRKATLVDSSLVSFFDYHFKKLPPGGSPAYMAPECFIDGSLFYPADLYSMGILFYELVTGARPFRAESLKDLIRQHLFNTPEHPCLNHPQYPRAFGEVILRLLQKNPADRFEDANDLIRWINRLFEKDYDLEPSAKKISKEDEDRYRQTNPMPFTNQTIAYLESMTPKGPSDWRHLVNLYLQKNDFEAVEKTLGKLTQLDRALHSARLLNKKGNYGGALTALEQVIREAEILTNDEQGEFYNAKGRVYYYLGRREDALESFLTAKEAYSNAENQDGMIHALTNAGNASVGLEKWEEAKQLYGEALDRAQVLGNPILEGRCYSNLGFMAQHRHQYDEAYLNYQRAYEAHGVMGHHQEQIQSALNLTGLYVFFGSWIKAEEIIREAIGEAKKIDNDYLLALGKLHEAEVHVAVGRLDLARSSIEWGLKLLGDARNPTDRFHFYLSAAEIDLIEEKLKSAKGNLMKAREEYDAGKLETFGPRLTWLFFILQTLDSQSMDSEEAMKSLRELESDENYFLNALYWLYHRIPDQERRGLQIEEKLQAHLQGVRGRIPEQFREGFVNRFKEETTMQIPLNKQASPESSHEMKRMIELNTSLASELDLKKLLEKIMDSLIEITDAERGFILLVYQDKLEKVFSKNYRAQDLARDEEEISLSLTQEVFEKKMPIITVDALNDERFSHTASIHKLKLRSIICLPFSFQEKVLGVIYLDNRVRKSLFEKGKIALLEPFAHQIGVVIHNARLFENKEQRITELTRTLEAKEREISLKYSYKNMIGRHPRMLQLYSMVDKVTDSLVPVVIHGESGVGKEMIAKAVHYNGKRKEGPFISINCAAVPENLLESELFGSAKGAYTGASEERPGLFELAHEGSLFLDEIGDMSLTMQTKLLRVVQEGEVRPIGGKKLKKVDVRIISASNMDLKDLVSKKKFREDLYYRIFVALITIPPLRERKDDIPLLVQHFLKEYAKKNDAPRKKISPEALRGLLHYSWPGNVRELENFIYQLCVFSEGDTIKMSDLSFKEELFVSKDSPGTIDPLSDLIDAGRLSLSTAKQEFEKNQIRRVLTLYDGHITKTAAHLKMVRTQLSRLIKNYNLKAQ